MGPSQQEGREGVLQGQTEASLDNDRRLIKDMMAVRSVSLSADVYETSGGRDSGLNLDPGRVLFKELDEHLIEEDVGMLWMLTKDKCLKNGDQKTPKTFLQWSNVMDNSRVDAFSIFCNIAAGQWKDKTLDDRNLNKMVQKAMEKRMDYARSKSLSMSSSRKDEHFQGREKEILKALDFLSKEFARMPGLEIYGEAAMGKTSLAGEICHKLPFKDLIQVDNLRGKRTVRDLNLSILQSILSKRAFSCMIEAQFTEGFSQPEDVLMETILDQLKQITTDTVVLLDNIDDICKHSADGMRDFLRKMLRLKTKKVQLIWTVQESQLRNGLFGLKNVLSLEVSELKPDDALLLFNSLKKSNFKQLGALDPKKILPLCQGCPLLIRAMVNKTVSNLIQHRCTKSDSKQELYSSLKMVFDCLPVDLQNTLVKLSILETTFDSDMASRVINLMNKRTGKLELDNLEKTMLIQTDKNRSKLTKSVDIALYCLHPLILSFVKDLCAQSGSEAYRLQLQQAELSFFKLFQENVENCQENCWWYAYMYNAQAHYIKFLDLLTQGQISIEKRNQQLFYEKLCSTAIFSLDKKEQENILIRMASGNNVEVSHTRLYAKVQRALLLLRDEDLETAGSVLHQVTDQIKIRNDDSEQSHESMCLVNYHYAEGLLSYKLSKSKHGTCVADLKDALTNLEISLKYLQKIKKRKKDLVTKCNILNTIGLVYLDQKKYQDAFECHKKAHEAITEAFSLHHFDAEYLFNMGRAKYAWGKKLQKEQKVDDAAIKLKEAKEMVAKAVAFKNKLGFNSDINSGGFLQELADIQQALREYDEGERAARQAYRIWRKRVQPPSEKIVNSLVTMAIIQFMKSREKKSASVNGCSSNLNENSVSYNNDCLTRCKRYCTQLVRILASFTRNPVDPEVMNRACAVHKKTLKFLQEDQDWPAIDEFYLKFRYGDTCNELPFELTSDMTDDVYALSSDEDTDSEEEEEDETSNLEGKQDSSGFNEDFMTTKQNQSQTILSKRGVLKKQHQVDDGYMR